MSKSSHSTAFLLAGSLAVTGVVAAASIWNIFRRRVPYLSNNDLLPDSEGDLQVVRKLTPTDREGLKETISSSFDYLYEVKEDKSVSSGDTADETDSEASNIEDMDAAVDSFVEYVLHIAENYGHIIKSVDSDDNYQGSVCVIPPVPLHIYKAYNLGAILRAKMLSLQSWRDLFCSNSDFDEFDGWLSRTSRPLLKDSSRDRWFVLNLGVAPSASGKRLGTRMMQQVFHLAKDAPVIWNVYLPPPPPQLFSQQA